MFMEKVSSIGNLISVQGAGELEVQSPLLELFTDLFWANFLVVNTNIPYGERRARGRPDNP